jgi:hypothetical protein
MTAHPSIAIHESPTACRDLAHLFVGTRVGYGVSRHVFSVEHDPTLVIKWENEGKMFQNQQEWLIWQSIKGFPETARWFAPCVDISPNGIWLLQKRCLKIPKEKYPKEMPDFLGDLKYQNFGLLGKRVVAMDYGVASISRLMWFRRKMVKTKWWGEDPING